MSRTLVVVPCGKAKIWDKTPNAGPTPARDTYTGAPFKVNREYAERFGDQWVVLSAKYGFLKPTDLVDGPYNVTFKTASSRPIAIEVLRRQIREQGLDKFDEVIALGGKDYRLVLEAAFATRPRRPRFPFAGQKLGEALGAVKRAVAAGKPY
jgi:hypothetical protein